MPANEGRGLLDWSWAEERLRGRYIWWLATTRPDGRPHLMPVWAVWVGDGVGFSTGADSRKAKNLAHNPFVTIVPERGVESVIVEGEAGPLPIELESDLRGRLQRCLWHGPDGDGRTRLPSEAHRCIRLHRRGRWLPVIRDALDFLRGKLVAPTPANGDPLLDQLERYAEHLDHYTELRLHTNHTKTVQMIGGNVVTNSASSRGGVSARTYDDGAFGFASFPSMSDDAIPGALKAAGSNAALLQRRVPMGKGDLPTGAVGKGSSTTARRSRRSPTASNSTRCAPSTTTCARRIPISPTSTSTSGSSRWRRASPPPPERSTYSYIPRTILMVRIATRPTTARSRCTTRSAASAIRRSTSPT